MSRVRMSEPTFAFADICATLLLLPLLLLLALLSSTPALTLAAGDPQIPLTCQWTDWTPVSGRQCHWRNRTVGLIVQDRQVNKFVTYCSQLQRSRRKKCESGLPFHQEGAAAEVEQEFLDPSAFMPRGEMLNDDPEVVRQSSDSCTDDRCGPLDGQWCYWIVYGGCEYLCRHAAKNETEVYIQKQRLCSCPRPRNSGRQCQGPSSVRERCECVSLAASFSTFLRSTEGILVAVGIGVVCLVMTACCLARVCCDEDDAAEDFKISELPQQLQQQQQQQQQQQPQSCLNFDDPDVIMSSAASRPIDLCSLPGTTATDSTAASEDPATASSLARLPDLMMPQGRQQRLIPPPLPPKRYKERQKQQQQQQQYQNHRKYHSEEKVETALKYTPPFPDEV